MKDDKKRPVGRPEKDETEKANYRLNGSRITKQQDEAYRAAADAAGLKLQAWVKSVCDKASGIS